MGRGRVKGFTLAEVLFGIGLFGLMLFMLGNGLSAVRGTQAGPAGEAEKLAELLRALRQQAITRHRPVGLAIPSQGGSRGAAQGYYILEGEVEPRVVQRVVLRDGTSAQVAGGFWPELPFTAAPATSFTASQYSLANWQPPEPSDPLVMFLPSGELLTNLPTYEGQVALVVGRALQCRWTTLSGRPAVEVERAQGAHTVWCSILGEVRVERNLPGAPARSSDQVAAGVLGMPPPLSDNSNAAPQFVDEFLAISPPANPNTLPHVAPGYTGTLRLKRYMSLKLYAQDPDGDALWCKWRYEGPSGKRDAAFTKETEVRMSYNPSTGNWESTWAWHAPVDVAGNENYRLRAEISDHRGGTAELAAQLGSGGQIRILPAGMLAFVRTNTSTGNSSTWISNWDGTDPVVVAANCTHPRWSHDGRRIAVKPQSAQQVAITSPDGRTDPRVIYNAGGQIVSPVSWAPDDDEVLFAEATGGGYELRQVDIWDGGTDDWPAIPAQPSWPAGAELSVDWWDSPDDDRDEAIVSSNTVGAMVVVDDDDDAVHPLNVAGADASFSPEGDKVIYRTGPDQFAIAAYDKDAHTISTTPEATFSLPGCRRPRFSRTTGVDYILTDGENPSPRNCFVVIRSSNQAVRLFNFPEPCSQPDWGIPES